MSKNKTHPTSMTHSRSSYLVPEEVFLEVFRKAIDSATQVLEEADVPDESIWSAYRAALRLLADTTDAIESEAQTALAA